MRRVVLALAMLAGGCVADDVVASWSSPAEGDWPAAPEAMTAIGDMDAAPRGPSGDSAAPLPEPDPDPPP